jgi:hypothetical protein
MSYYHTEWLPRSVVEENSRQGKSRVQKFMMKPSWELQWSEDDPFNPSFAKVWS